jgi:hypothetical protein
MDRRGGHVNPAQFFRHGKLLRTQRDREDDLGVAQLFFNSLIE